MKKIALVSLFLALLMALPLSAKEYNSTAKNTLSHNDITAFVYQWFALFDHQAPIAELKIHLPKEKVMMDFPDFPIRSHANFARWYDGVKENIQWNTHLLSNVTVKGSELEGFEVGLHVNWKAKTYEGQKYDVSIAQEWTIQAKDKQLIITKHKAWVMK